MVMSGGTKYHPSCFHSCSGTVFTAWLVVALMKGRSLEKVVSKGLVLAGLSCAVAKLDFEESEMSEGLKGLEGLDVREISGAREEEDFVSWG